MRPRAWFACLILAGALAGAPGRAQAIGSAGDPLEAANRLVFAFNRLLAPPFRALAQAVDVAVDPTLIQAARDFLNNLAEPGVALSYLAEGDVTQTRVALKRLAINSVEGPLGLRDVAAAEGITQHPADLAQVLCHYDVPQGPYLVLPLYGGMTLRALVAQVATVSAGLAVFGEIYIGYRVASFAVHGLDRPGSFRHVQFLDDGLPDPYAATRAWQRLRSGTLCQ